MDRLSCADAMDAGPGYALDILDPAQRSQLELHLGDCPDCRARVEQLSRSAAALLDLTGTTGHPDPATRQAAPIDPQSIATQPTRREPTLRHDGHPVGRQPSNSEWTDGPARPDQEWVRRPVRGRGRRRLRTATTLAAAAALMVGTTFGPEIASGAHHGGPVPAATGVLMSAGRQVGEVIFYSVAPTMALEVKGISGKGPLTAEILTTAGHAMTAGSFRLYEGAGYWAGNPNVAPADVAAVSVVDGQGRVVATTSPA